MNVYQWMGQETLGVRHFRLFLFEVGTVRLRTLPQRGWAVVSLPRRSGCRPIVVLEGLVNWICRYRGRGIAASLALGFEGMRAGPGEPRW